MNSFFKYVDTFRFEYGIPSGSNSFRFESLQVRIPSGSNPFRFKSLQVRIPSGSNPFRFESLQVRISSGSNPFRFESLQVRISSCLKSSTMLKNIFRLEKVGMKFWRDTLLKWFTKGFPFEGTTTKGLLLKVFWMKWYFLIALNWSKTFFWSKLFLPKKAYKSPFFIK